MKFLHGPTFKFETPLIDDDPIYVQDHLFDLYDGTSQIKTLLDSSNVKPKFIMMDHVLLDDEFGEYTVVPMPIFLASQIQMFGRHPISINWHNRQSCVNFSINKPRLHRKFLVALIRYFGLKDYRYTLCWHDHQVSNLQKHTNVDNFNPLYKLIADAYDHGILPRAHINEGEYVAVPRWIINCWGGGNADRYEKFLRQDVYESTHWSLVTEVAFWEKQTIVSEKTLMPWFGGNVPIWVGGWKIPDYLRDMGFDVFDDFIDHSYCRMPDPWDRCYHAIADNLGVLTMNLQSCKDLWRTIEGRLKHNLDLCRKNIWLDMVKSNIANLPMPYKNDMEQKITELFSFGQ